ncbi:MAG: biotin synthase BioB [Candidatus Omnitrophica bacterium]|nr:biotin synthase BioB [Candidatus Omnitrophota bacterium]
MQSKRYQQLTDSALRRELISTELSQWVLTGENVDLLKLLDAAFTVRKHFVGMDVSLHIINNAQNGFCPEDCHYCPQAKSSKSEIEEYPLKSENEILKEAEDAYKKGAHRYCMVFAGRGPSERRVRQLSDLIHKIKSKYPIEVCVSAGLLDEQKAQTLKQAGLDRLNHNLNTSEKNYANICTTHTYQDRIDTLNAGRRAGLQLCSGVIVGMDESIQDIITLARTLREFAVESIPVNFFIPVDGHQVNRMTKLSPEYCLRVLCLFRLMNPDAEIRIAAGRELHLRQMQVLGLYPANSLFLDGYLNTRGDETLQTLQMITDAGFQIKSDVHLDEILTHLKENKTSPMPKFNAEQLLKTQVELRPHR